MTRHNRINNEIRAPKVRLIDISGKQQGIVNLRSALEMAKEAEVDLVEISTNTEPPVCRIIDYGKFIYEKNKSSRDQKKKQRNIQIKEIKFRPNTDISDYQVKLRSLVRFLKDGNKTKITVRFRGREVIHQQIGTKLLNRLKLDLNELSVVEFFPSKIEGKQMTMVLSPKRK